MAEKNKRKKIKRDLIEWAVIIAIGLILYLTGLHTQVIGTLQGLVLKTGLIRPNTSVEEAISQAEYQFRLMDQDGNLLEGTSLEGKVVFINLWATWCPPCIAEMPDINRLYGELEDQKDIRFILISLDDDFNKAIRFVEKKGYDFDIYQFASPIPEVYHSQMIPTTFVISPEGNIVVKKEGMAKYNSASFRKFLHSMLE
jgi:thiol-disulfide isomerase/thioredoxin